jgi:hypothetical protein
MSTIQQIGVQAVRSYNANMTTLAKSYRDPGLAAILPPGHSATTTADDKRPGVGRTRGGGGGGWQQRRRQAHWGEACTAANLDYTTSLNSSCPEGAPFAERSEAKA